MYEWGRENEGNASGNWKHELTSHEKMVESGWQEAGNLRSRHSNRELPGTTWSLYTRNCKAGESFVLRNHKYQAPIVFSEKTYFETGPVEISELPLDKHARIQKEERLAKLVEEFNTMLNQARFAEARVIAQQAKREFRHTSIADKLLQMVSHADSVSVPDPELPKERGLLGRMTIRTEKRSLFGIRITVDDSRYLFHYQHGLIFSQGDLPKDLIGDNRFVVKLEGYLKVPRDMVVIIYHAGGGVSHDINRLYVNGRELGSVGDDRKKHATYEVPLAEGYHPIRWELTGGTFRSNLLAFIDPDEGKLLPLLNGGDAPLHRSADDTIVRVHGTKLEWPLEADKLPETVLKNLELARQHYKDASTDPSPTKQPEAGGF